MSRMSEEVRKHLSEMSLESLGPKLEALGVRTLHDLALVDDADLVRWGHSTIERRRFFAHVRSLFGEASVALTPPSALTASVPSGQKAAGARSTRPEPTMGPARLDELLGRGSAEHQVPRLAERLLATSGPQDVFELANRLASVAPALAQGYQGQQWPQFVEASVRGYKRLTVEDGVLAGDKPVVSITTSVLFSASEEVVADTSCWVRVVTALATPAQVAVVAALCRASREVADGSEVWSKLLSRWYPKATLLNPDWVAQADLEKKLEEALDNDYTLAALTRRLNPDTAYAIGDLLGALPQQTTPKALVKFMSAHPESFRQSPDGAKFCVSRKADGSDLERCKSWRTVNPFSLPPMVTGGSGVTSSSGPAPANAPPGRPTELKKLTVGEPRGSNLDAPPAEGQTNVCQKLDPKVAFRLYHTGLLSQRSDQSRRGKLEAWEYYTESNSKCVMAAGDLMDLTESRVRAIRSNDPAVVHELVAQTMEGMVYKVPFGFWNRRVRVLSNALNGSQLRVGREQRKKYERKLVEFMEWVKKERGFGYYQCEQCGSRWKSGFSYEEITQQCLSCGHWQRPYRIGDLESTAERTAREAGEPLPAGSRRADTGPLSRDAARNALAQQPAVYFRAPVLEHQDQQRPHHHQQNRYTPWNQGREEQQQPQPQQQQNRYTPWNRGSRLADSAGLVRDAVRNARSQQPPALIRPQRLENLSHQQQRQQPSQEAQPHQPQQQVQPPQPQPPQQQYTPGGGGFFARRESTPPEPVRTAPSAQQQGQPEQQPQYTPGGGGFFARRAGASASDATSSSEPRSQLLMSESAPTSAQPQQEPQQYTPGGGGFFARRATNSGPSHASDKEPTNPPVSASASTATQPEQEVQRPQEPAQYTPGGGGFFAQRAVPDSEPVPAQDAQQQGGHGAGNDTAQREAVAQTAAAPAKRELEEVSSQAAPSKRVKHSNSAASATLEEPALPGAQQQVMGLCAATDGSLIEAINAVVTFSDEITGEAKVLVAQPSDVAFLLSDSIFQPLLRRIAAEIVALDAGAIDVDMSSWQAAPCDSLAAAKFAEARGYAVDGDGAATLEDGFRRSLLVEAAADLMVTRMEAGRALALPALAGPPGKASSTEMEDLAGVAITVAGSEATQLAGKLVSGIWQTLGEGSPGDRPSHELLAVVASTASAGLQAKYPGRGLVLHGGWTLLQEMQIREVSLSLQREYTVRRHILLRRLDVSVEAMSASAARSLREKVAGILGRMWAGWRRSAEDAPALSEWSVLAASEGVLARAVSQRVTHAASATASKVKKVQIGSVPGRGGVPEGYGKDSRKSSNVAASAPATRTPGRGMARPAIPGRLVSAGETPSSSSGQNPSGSNSAAHDAQTLPTQITAKRQREPGTQSGARSTNKDLESEWKKKLKEDRESGAGQTYWQVLAEARGQEGTSRNRSADSSPKMVD
mmetsp:Transcript_43094/g.78351  ORF Transcript_43094/g.78351 Transcript_43094/m.78351 type:complete len:1437 (+) Transcript_43094:93-4403(+)